MAWFETNLPSHLRKPPLCDTGHDITSTTNQREKRRPRRGGERKRVTFSQGGRIGFQETFLHGIEDRIRWGSDTVRGRKSKLSAPEGED